MTKRWKNRPEGSTWGDWGEDDQKGRMNLLTPERVKAAVGEGRPGRPPPSTFAPHSGLRRRKGALPGAGATISKHKLRFLYWFIANPYEPNFLCL
jgi:hypothetical protein